MIRTDRLWRFLLPVALVSTLSACVFAPGQYVTPGSWLGQREDEAVDVIPVTPKLFVIDPSLSRMADPLPTELTQLASQVYRLGPGDILNVTVWDHPELTIPAGTQLTNSDANGRVVRPDGTLYYPYVGAIQAAGLTVDELRSELAKRLAKYIAAPQVDVAVSRYTSQRVYLGGAFKTTQPLSITSTALTLSDAIGQAEVNSLEADLSGLVLLRDGQQFALNMDRLTKAGISLSSIVLKANDTLYLPYNDRRKVYVLGEVFSQRALAFKTDGISLAEALATVGGLRQETSKAQAVYVIRGAERDSAGFATTVYQLNANSVTALALADRFQLRAGDTVYVGPARITRWNRFISQLFPSASLLRTADSIAN